MRLSRFLSLVTCITSFSLLYVYQQTEVFRLAYVGQRNQAFCQDLLDKNTILRYNIGRSGSLVCLGDKISGSSDYQMPDSYRLVRIASPKEGVTLAESNKKTLAARIFGIQRQAEAKTLGP